MNRNYYEMKKTVFLDTNVILDFLLDRSPFADAATDIICLVAEKDIKAYVSPITVSNIYYILRRLAGHDKVIKKLKLLLTIVSVTKITKQIILESLNSKFCDIEDAIQSFAADEYESIDVIITRNTKNFKHSNLAVMTPDNFLRVFPA